MVSALIAVALSAAMAVHAATGAPASLASDFTAALADDDVRALEALSANGRGGEGFGAATFLLVSHDHISVVGHEVVARERVGDTEILHVEIDGTAVNAWRALPSERLHRRWALEAVPTALGWRLRSAEPEERWLARQLAAASGAAIERAAPKLQGLERPLFLRELADLASNQSDTGLPAVEWALAAARADGDAVTEAYVARMRAHVDLVSGRIAEAAQRAVEAVALAQGAGDPEVLGEAQFGLGIARWFSGDVPGAVVALRSSAAGLERFGDPRIGLRGIYMASELELGAGHLRQSLALAEELEDWLQRFPWPQGQLDAAFRRAAIHLQLGNNEIAAALYERAVAVAEVLHDDYSLALALYDLASARQRMGQHDVRELLERAAIVARGKAADGELAVVVGRLAQARASADDLAGAEAAYQDAIATARKGDDPAAESLALGGLGELRLQQGRPSEAVALAGEALEAAGRPARGDRPPASPATPWTAHTLLGRALLALGREAPAVDAFRLAILDVERSRGQLDAQSLGRARFFGERLAPYRELLRVLLAKGNGEEALRVSEQIKARALEDALGRGAVDLSPELSEQERARERELELVVNELNRKRLQGLVAGTPAGQLEAELAAARRALDGFRSEAYVRHPRLAARRLPEIDPLETARQILPMRGAVLELTVLEEETVALVVRRSRDDVTVDLRRIAVRRNELERLVLALARALERRDPEFAVPAQELYDRLMAPVTPLLAGVDALAVVPDGILWRVPFELLGGEHGESLVARMAVFRAPALRLLGKSGEEGWDGQARPRVLALGDPQLAQSTRASMVALERAVGLGPLPDAAREVREIGRLYGAERSEVRVGTAAQEGAVKELAGGFDVLHFATHGLVDDRAPMYSALAFATSPDATSEDGLLEAREIADLRLHARLAVLSACETGRGALDAGEGMVGLSWAFLAAGVPTLVVSDRNAPSEATAVLMVELHRQLLAGRAPAEALRRAELALAADPRFDHPYYWSAFSVVGTGW